MLSLRSVLWVPLSILIGGLGVIAAAQDLYDVDTKPLRGFMPTSDQLSSSFDSIDAVHGKLHLQIPLASLPPGQGGSGFDVDLVYDSRLYDIVPSVQAPVPPYTELREIHELASITGAGGWTYNFMNYRLENEEKAGVCEAGGMTRLYRLRLVLPDSSSHTLHLKGYGNETNGNYSGDGFFAVVANGVVYPCPGQGTPYQAVSGVLTYYTADGSYLKVEIQANGSSDWSTRSWRLYFPDGRRVVRHGYDSPTEPYNSVYIYDANGNRVRLIQACSDPPPAGDCSMPYTTILDDSNRAIRIDYNVTDANLSTETRKRDTVTSPGPNGNVTWTIDWQLLHIGGDGRKYLWTQSPPYDESQFRNIDFRFWVVQYVQLPLAGAVPPGQTPSSWNSYEFRYSDNSSQGYGELDYARAPSGAEYSYRYRLEYSCSQNIYCADAETIAHDNSVKKKAITHDGVTDLRWSYTFDHTGSTITNPDGGRITHTFFVKNNPNDWASGLVYRIDEPNGSVRKRIWGQNKAYGLSSPSAYRTPNNPYIQREAVTVGDALQQPSKTAVVDFVYDKNGNLLSSTGYDWVPYTGSSVETGTAIRRRTSLTYYVSLPEASVVANPANAYWQTHNPAVWPNPLSARRLDAVWRRTISADGMTQEAATEFNYDSPYANGNITAEKRWDTVKSPALPGPGGLNSANAQVLTRSYDGYGNLIDIYEPEIRTRFTYGPSGNVLRIDYAYATSAQRSWQYTWTPNGTAIVSRRDLDNYLTTSFTYDSVGRIRSVSEAGVRQTETIYDDANRKVTTKRDLTFFGDRKLQGITRYDQLGRVVMVQTSDGPPLNTDMDGIKAATIYIHAFGGQRVVTSTPYRTPADTTLEWSCTQNDQLGRVTAAAIFKGGSPPNDCESTSNRTGITRTAYDADWTTVTDPASKIRKEQRDTLGRPVTVIEDPSGLNYSTSYGYDSLDNLRQVTQGSQIRTFVYSSLSRLRSAANPESGTATYTYFDSGDLRTRTDPRGVVTTYGYDELHRLRTRIYTNDPQSTPKATYSYYLAGAASPNAGQLQSVTSTDPLTQATIATTLYNAYDTLGRVKTSTHIIAGNPATASFTYTYWLNDSLRTMLYPSGRVLNYAVDDAGRTTKVYTTAKTYADTIGIPNPYAADGRLAQIKLGNGLHETRDYQAPGIPTLYKLGTSPGGSQRLSLEYHFSGAQNAGNLMSQTITNGARTWTQSFSYDSLNRLLTASEAGGFSRTYGYDRYGNRWVNASFGLSTADIHEPTVSTNFDAATNRLLLQGSTYDSAGNQTFYPPYGLTYDAENRKTKITSASNGNMILVYDADGRRVKKTWTPGGGSPTTTYYIYNALGKLAAEYSNQTSTGSGTAYPFTDMLGSLRAVTDNSGALSECYDYLPFGRMLGSADNTRSAAGCYPNLSQPLSSRLPQKFTGKERDPETSLDFFGARYYSGAQGRFTSADRPFVDWNPADPQSWNLYAYVRNNPLIYIDPTGQDCIYTGDFGADESLTVTVARGECKRKHGVYVDGTIDIGSLKYNSRRNSLSYSFSGSSENTVGFGIVDLVNPGELLNARGLALIMDMAARVDASNKAILTFPAVTTVAGVTAGFYPVAAQAVNEWALGASVGRLFYEGDVGLELAKAFGAGKLLSQSALGLQYAKWNEPLGKYGWTVLSRFWASGSSGAVNMFPTLTKKAASDFWRTELPILLRNPNVWRIWR